LLDGVPITRLGPDGPGRQRALALAPVAPGSALEREEIFGPVLGVVMVPDLAAAIAWTLRQAPPLAIYLFGATRAEESAVAAATRSGALICDRTVEYAAFTDLGFGGVGTSGQGRYHGWQGFREFSHFRARARHGRWSLSRLFDLPRKSFAERLISKLVKPR